MSQTVPEKSTIVLDPRDPMPSARELIKSVYTSFDDGALVPTLHHIGGELPRVGRHPLRARLRRRCAGGRVDVPGEGEAPGNRENREPKEGETPKKPKRYLVPFQPYQRHVGDVFAALKAVTHLDTVAPPAWVPGPKRNRPPAREMLACANGLLHIGTRQLHPHTPEYIGFNVLPYAYSPGAPKPTAWLEFLTSLWPDDAKLIQTLREWCGYCVTTLTLYQKMLMMIGPKRAGKGTIGRILSAMIGPNNVANPALGSLSRQFGLQPLLDKQLALISDAKLGDYVNQSAIAERLLGISGEDAQAVPRKFKDDMQIRMPLRFMMLTNELPEIEDTAGALASRFIILQLTRTFFGTEDPDLESKLKAELPSILTWALDGLASLNARRRFVQPASAQDAVRDLETLGSATLAFIRDCCREGAEESVSVDNLYSAWRQWCRGNGKPVTDKAVFGKDLAAAVPGRNVTNPRGPDGRQVPTYTGIGLVQPWPAGEFEPIADDILSLIRPTNLASNYGSTSDDAAKRLKFKFGRVKNPVGTLKRAV